MKLENIFNKFNNFVSNKIEDNKLYNNMIDNSSLFLLNNDINSLNETLIEANWYEYTDMCVYINLDIAKKIDKMLPIDEMVIGIYSIIQKKDNKELFIVFTSKKILVLDKEKYTILNYGDILVCEQINKSLMSQVINFNGIILGINVNQEDFGVFYNLIFNAEYRNNCIKEKIKYLCGIIPVYQKINKIGSGISIDSNNVIVFHNKKIDNYICKYDDILNYELLEDNTPVLKRRTMDQVHSLGFSKNECLQMSMRVTMNNNFIFEIMILEPTVFNNPYSHTNSDYIKHYQFAKEIMDKLDSFNTNLY